FPVASFTVRQPAVAGDKPDRAQDAGKTRSNLDGVQEGNAGRSFELEVQLSVSRGRDVLEHFDIGRAWPCFRRDVELVQPLAAIPSYVKHRAGLAAACRIVFAIQGLGEMQAQFVNAGS